MFARPEFREAARGAITLYVNLFDEPPAKKVADLEAKIAAMSSDDAAKFREHMRVEREREEVAEKARLEALEEQKKIAAAQESKNKSPKDTPQKVDPDPVGEALENTNQPLEQAMKFVEPLLKHAADYEETQLLAFEVFIRQGKPILALKTVNEALKIAPSSFRAKRNIVRLARSVEKMDESNAMKKILTMQVGKLMGDKTASEFAASMSFEEASHPVDIAAVAFAKREVGDDSALVEGAKATKMGAEFSLDDYLNALDTYADASEAAAEALTKTCAQAFPYATCFGGAKCTAREN